MRLSEEQLAEFDRTGKLKLDYGFDAEMLDDIVAEVEGLYEHDYRQAEFRSSRVQDAWRNSKAARRLATHRGVAESLRQLYGRKPLPFQTLNFPTATSQLPHSDTIHFNCIPAGYMCGVWVALEDVDEDNGALIYYPGSHKLKEYSMQDFGLGTGYDYYKGYEAAIQELIREQNLEPEYGVMKKGEALIWAANLLHGGAPLRDTSRTRHSQVTHYYFEDCRYYTPMNSAGSRIDYRNPVWITETPTLRERIGKLKNRLRPVKHAILGRKNS